MSGGRRVADWTPEEIGWQQEPKSGAKRTVVSVLEFHSQRTASHLFGNSQGSMTSATRTPVSLYQPQKRSLVGECLEKERSGLSDERKALGHYGGISIPDLDIVAARRARVETNCAR